MPSNEEAVNQAIRAKDLAYAERNQLVCAISKLFPSHLLYHDAEDQTWDKEWHWIVCIHGPAGQMTWHIHDSELPMFEHLLVPVDIGCGPIPYPCLPDGQISSIQCGGWDGHATEEKYQRLAQVGV